MSFWSRFLFPLSIIGNVPGNRCSRKQMPQSHRLILPCIPCLPKHKHQKVAELIIAPSSWPIKATMGLKEMVRMCGFDMPIGPEADLREMEYLSALHQTGANFIRPDGTISAVDVRVFLRSRYGLYIPQEEAELIVRGLGGTAKDSTGQPHDHAIIDIEKNDSSVLKPDGDTSSDSSVGDSSVGKKSEYSECEDDAFLDDDECLDMIQFVAVLFIPTLQRAKRQVDIEKGIVKIAQIPALPNTDWRLIFKHPRQYRANKKLAKELTLERKEREFHDSLEPSVEGGNCIHMVLRVLFEAIGENSGSRTPGDRQLDALPRVILTHDLVVQLLEAFGFADLATKHVLVDQMVEAAGGSGTVFDEIAFAKALTGDVTLRETGIEDKTSETFEDVYGYDMSKLQYGKHEAVDRKRMKKEGKMATFLVKQQNENSSSTDPFVQEEKETSVAKGAGPGTPTPTHSKDHSNAPSTEGNGGWVSFDNDDDKNVDWSSAKNGEIEIAESGAPLKQEQVSTLALVENNPEKMDDDEVSVELKTPTYITTAPAIDYVDDEYKSIAYLCATWVFYIFGAAGFMSLLGLVDLQIFKCSDGFGCTVVQKVWNWLVFALMLSFGGLIVVLPLSLGNDPYRRGLLGTTISFIWAIFFGAFPFLLLSAYVRDIPHSPDGVLTETEKLLSQPYFRLLAVIFFIFGCLLAAKMVLMIPTGLIPTSSIKGSRLLSYLFVPSSTRSASFTKQAATRKINKLVDQARSMHFKTQLGRPISPLDQFQLCGMSTESRGGLLWTWKEIFSGRLVETHGVWLQSSLLVGQEGQIVVLVFGLVLALWGAMRLAENAAQQRRDLELEPPSYLRDQALYVTPYPWVIWASFGAGVAVAAIIGITLVLLYIPSNTATVFKLRSGIIGSFRDPKFATYRKNADVICYNVGNMIYALIGSTSLFFLIGAGAIFLITWAPTRNFMINLIGWGLGLVITMLIKMVVVKCLRKNNQQALYRKKPRAANITGLCLMCWNIALGAGLMLGRLTQFLLAAAFWIGRTDAQFLDDDVKLFGYNFDKIAINFRKDIIVHEAHRHPFLDRIGGMYLMRHAYGKEFGSNAGARWRQLFCVALMPWYKKFRSLRNLELVLEEKAAKAAAASVVDGSFAPVLTAEEMIQLSAFRQRRKALTSTTNAPPKKVEYPTVSQRGEYMASF